MGLTRLKPGVSCRWTNGADIRMIIRSSLRSGNSALRNYDKSTWELMCNAAVGGGSNLVDVSSMRKARQGDRSWQLSCF
jgi:hypothetical protein